MVRHCPRCHVELQDLDTLVPWCDRCAWTPPETDALPAPLPRRDEAKLELPPERFVGDADADHYRRTRLPEQDPSPIREEIRTMKRRPRWLGGGWIMGGPCGGKPCRAKTERWRLLAADPSHSVRTQ